MRDWRLPLRLTIPHYFDFGNECSGAELQDPQTWDALRLDSDGDFALPGTRAGWEALAGAHPEIEQRARSIDGFLGRLEPGGVASYGVGSALLEFWLHRLTPRRRLIVADFAPQTIATLQRLFPEGRPTLHDLMHDGPLDAELHLFHRIDTEFSDQAWREVLRRFGSSHIVFVAGGAVGLRGALRAISRLSRKGGMTRAGFVRTAVAIESLWASTHTAESLELYDLPAWHLAPRG
jgi:hypothetical protein